MRLALLTLLLILIGLFVAACGPAAPEEGVALATVPALPTQTPLAAAAAGPLPGTLSARFMDTEVGFQYPVDWGSYQRGQYVVAFDQGDPRLQDMQPQGFPQVGVQVRLLPQTDLAAPDAVASRMLFWQWYPGSNEGRLYTEQGRYFGVPIPETQRVLAFRWGAYDAALYTHTLDQQHEDIQAVHVAVLVEAPARYAVFWMQAGQISWRAALPVMEGILATAAINGEPLPSVDVLDALDALLGA